jgi:hypothetical protein
MQFMIWVLSFILPVMPPIQEKPLTVTAEKQFLIVPEARPATPPTLKSEPWTTPEMKQFSTIVLAAKLIPAKLSAFPTIPPTKPLR